jgi:hypothetical protein
MMARWKDGVVDKKLWLSKGNKTRLLIVCPEPNERNMIRQGNRQRDMRNLLLYDEHPKTQFPTYIRQAVRAVHGLPYMPSRDRDAAAHKRLMQKIAFIDLKNTGGGSRSDASRILHATKMRRRSMIRQIRRMRPTHIAVAGRKAHRAFDAYLLRNVPPGTRVFRIDHPSRRGWTAREYYNHIREQFRDQ